MAKKEILEFASDNSDITQTGYSEKIERQEIIQNEHINETMYPKEKQLINCLKNERVIVRFIGKTRGIVNNPENPYHGGMGETCKRTYVTPITGSGGRIQYKNVLTNDEKDYLEYVMGLRPNALSVYQVQDNYWRSAKVVLKKGDNFFDLSNPHDYIAYKILLLNPDEIAPSLDVYQSSPKVTHLFYILKEGEEVKKASSNLSISTQAYILFGSIKDSIKKLRIVTEIMEGRSLTKDVKEDILFATLEKHLKNNPKMFIQVVEDPYLDTKIIIRDGVDLGLINRVGDFFYLKADNRPMCKSDGVQDPTLKSACEFLNNPRNQEIKLSLEAHINAIDK